ncbi:MAG: type II toxin-antitoxin system HigA family antitoxin [Bradymonadia bacterium]
MSIEIRPIRDDADHARAVALVDDLWPRLASDQDARDAMEVLSVLIDEYERRHHALPPPSPIEAIKFRMEQQGLSRKDLEPYIGHSGRVSEVLSGKRSLSLDMIRKLHVGLGIPTEILLGIAEEFHAA